MPHVRATLPVQAIVDRLAREEQQLKRVGAHAEAAGVRDAVVQILRMADEPEPDAPALEPSA